MSSTPASRCTNYSRLTQQYNNSVPNVDLPALCSPRYKPGPPSDEAQVLSERVNEALCASRVLPLETLVIQRGKAVWTIFVDATCVSCDGAVFDASLVAVVAALRNSMLPGFFHSCAFVHTPEATLPKAVYDPDTNTTLCYRGAPRVPLRLSSNVPLSVSFGIFDSSVFFSLQFLPFSLLMIYRKVIFADPTAFEEPLLDTTISVVLSDKEQIVSVSQLGPGLLVDDEDEDEDEDGVHRDVLKECIALAQSRIGELQNALP